MTDPGEERLLTIEDVARIVGRRPAWVHDRAKRGEIPCVWIGRSARFRTKSINEWLAERERPAESSPE